MIYRSIAPLILAFMLCFCLTSGASEDKNGSPVFSDPEPRIVTVERWGFSSAIAWAVYPDKIIAFLRNDLGKPERLIAQYPLSSTDLKSIREQIEGLPPGTRGKLFRKKDVFDGNFLRISFSPDGSLTRDRIELENVFLPEVVPLLNAIDKQITSGRKIEYSERMGERFKDRETETNDVYQPK